MNSLAVELDSFKEQFLAKAPPEAVKKMMAANTALEHANLPARAVAVGQQAPDFSLPDMQNTLVTLSARLARRPVVVSFYRGGWCPYCNLQLRALGQSLDAIERLGAELIAISPQTPDNSLSTVEKNSICFTVLSDVGNKVARRYGLVFTLAESLRPLYKSFGIDIPASNGDETWELPLPATYVIDQQGVVRGGFVNADYTRRMEPADIIASLKLLQAGA
ncbi:MAG: AhpC/TSA family protein [Phycisphaerales bacterium]|nr:AhpC/TSA family protein [Phycisphaerales bacterium]